MRNPTPGGEPGLRQATQDLGLEYRVPRDVADNVTRVRYERSGVPPEAANRALDHPEPNTAYVVDGRHLYITDGQGRTVYAQTRLPPRVREGVRDEERQRVSGMPDRLGRDAGMHLFGHRFSGPVEQINLSPGAIAMNSGNPGYAGHERDWRIATEGTPARQDVPAVPPRYVDVVVQQRFTGDGLRADRWDVDSRVEGGNWQSASEYNPRHSEPGYGTNENYVPRHLDPDSP